MRQIIYGIIGLLLVVLEEYVLSRFFNFSFLGFCLIVIPVGGFLIGGWLGFVMSRGIKTSGKKLNKTHILIALIIGILAMPAIKAQEYLTTYVAEDGTINREFDGNPISEYYIDGKKINIIEYIKLMEENANFTVTSRYASDTDIEFETAGTINYLILLFEFLSIIIASLILVLCLKSEKYCDKCKCYYKKKTLFRYKPEQSDEMKGKIEEALLSRYGLEDIKGIKVSKTKSYYEVQIEKCPKCGLGILNIIHMEMHGSKFKENLQNRIKYDLIKPKYEDEYYLFETKNSKINEIM